MHNKLLQILTLPLKDDLDIKACFDFCQTVDEIREVIRKIPAEFGAFEVLSVNEREGYFTIYNSIEKGGELKSETVSYDFYDIKEDYYYDFRRR